MNASNQISAAVFSAFVKCPTKAHLLAIDEPAPGAFFVDIEARISSMYKAVAKRQLGTGAKEAQLLEFGQLWCSLDYGAFTHCVDSDTVVYDFALPQHRNAGPRPQKSSPFGNFVPVLFLHWDKPDSSDSLLVCFGALALSQATGILADTGTLIYGDGYRHRTVRIGDHVVQTCQTIDAIRATRSSREPPPLVLNRHCAVCDFQPRCRALAIEHDDLSLLTAMTGKERAKCNAKGIFTISQMSYGYRPRRRKRTRPDAEGSTKSAKRIAPVARNDHKLRALAFKKNQSMSLKYLRRRERPENRGWISRVQRRKSGEHSAFDLGVWLFLIIQVWGQRKSIRLSTRSTRRAVAIRDSADHSLTAQ